jgi:signal transduction histidine kinase
MPWSAMNGPLTTRRRWWMVLPGLALALGASLRPAPAAPRGPRPWHVLILYGAPPDNPATAAGTEALRAALSAGAAPRLVDFQSEVQDTLSFDAAHHEAELLALLRKKGSAGRLDLVMPMGGPALRFARRHRKDLWPGVPIVGFGASAEVLREEAIDGNTTGIAFDVDEAGTLRLARSLQPDAERVVLIAGSSEYDRSWWPRLEAAVARAGNGLEVERLLGQPLGAVLDRVSRLPRRSIVLYTTISRDADGETFTPANVAELLARASVAPVYAVWESQLGRGVVGGSMERLAAHGRRVAALALRVLGGASPGIVPVAPAAEPVPIVDWRQLRRFGLSEAALPPGAVVLDRPPSFVKEHRGLVATVGLVLAVQTALIVALLAQARDRRKAEAEAARQRAELIHAARLSAVGELTASIAHEINQPLGAILSNAEAAELFLDADPPGLDRVRQILGDIQEEDRRASDVIREIRALSRKQLPESRPVDLNDVVRDVMTLVTADARRRNVELQVDLGAPLPLVNGDRTQLRQVVLNLALNSLEALGSDRPGDRLVRIRTAANGAGVELTVSDTGPGLDEGQLSHMFESFFTTKQEGLGLGLSIVRSIVEAHVGRVAAENNRGRGATFRVHLPALQGKAATRREQG